MAYHEALKSSLCWAQWWTLTKSIISKIQVLYQSIFTCMSHRHTIMLKCNADILSAEDTTQHLHSYLHVIFKQFPAIKPKRAFRGCGIIRSQSLAIFHLFATTLLGFGKFWIPSDNVADTVWVLSTGGKTGTFHIRKLSTLWLFQMKFCLLEVIWGLMSGLWWSHTGKPCSTQNIFSS